MSLSHVVQFLLVSVLLVLATLLAIEGVGLLRRRSRSPQARTVARVRLGSVVLVLGLALEFTRAVVAETVAIPTAIDLAVHAVAGGSFLVCAALMLPNRRALADVLDLLDESERVLEGLVDGAAEVLDRAPSSLKDARLTTREREILSLIGRGIVTDREISRLLHISPATSGTHVRNILRKTGYGSRRHLLLAAIREDARAAS